MRHFNHKPHPMTRRSARKRSNNNNSDPSASNSPLKKKRRRSNKMSNTILFEEPLQLEHPQTPIRSDLPVFPHQSSSDETITLDHAIVMTPVQGASPLDYVKSVSSIIGSGAIHGIFEDIRGVKIYLKQKKFVQMVIHHGVQVKGRQMNVDFLVPPATRVVLSQVDPIIPDKSLMCLLGCFGSFESPLIRQRISDEEGYSHIESSSRVIYMKIDEDKTIPLKLPLVHDNCLHEIQVTVEGPPKVFRYSASQTEA